SLLILCFLGVSFLCALCASVVRLFLPVKPAVLYARAGPGRMVSAMTAPRTILITGASGEIGHGLIDRLAESGRDRILALDLHAPEDALRAKCYRFITGDIAESAVLENLAAAYDLDAIYHLAALLSTKSERQPRLAHRVNVDGTLNLLELGVGQARQ